jgi:hypothetical protein
MSNDRGLAAFPSLHVRSMSLRDYFAAAAMQGMLSEDANAYTWVLLAEGAYECADAMLKERDK